MEIRAERPAIPLKFLLLVPLLFFAGLTLIRSHPPAVRSYHPVNLAMPALRTYGIGLSVPNFVHPVVSPQEAWRYREDIRAIFLSENFAELEKIAQTNRDNPTFLPGGVWKSHEFYVAIESPASYHPITDADYESYIEKAKRWQAAFPESSAARISSARSYLSFANFGGTAYADSVSEQQWHAFNERTAAAQQILLDAAHAIQPTNYHLYRSYAHYLLPQWYGSFGDIQKLAEEAAAKNPEPLGSMLYFQVMGEVACYCQTMTEQLAPADWKKLKIGYAKLTETYGPSNYNANLYGAMSAVFCDKDAGREAFRLIAFRDTGVWTDDKSFSSIRDWTNSPDSQ